MTETITKIERLIKKTANIAGIIAFPLTLIAVIALPVVAGAGFFGALAFHAIAASGTAAQVVAAALGGIGGALAGLVPLLAIDFFGKQKDKSYGTIEALCLPAAAVEWTTRKILSPLKLLNAFSNASKQQPGQKKTSAPQAQNQPKP